MIRSDLSRANEPDGSFYSWSTRSNENTALRDFFTLSLSVFPPRGFLFRRGHDKAAREVPRFRGKRFALPIFKHVKPIDREINDRLIVATRLVRAYASWERRGRRVFRNRSHFFFSIAKRFPRFFCAVQGNISRRSLLGKQIASSSSSSIPD